MADIRELMLAVDEGKSEDFRNGWEECVCWINDRYEIRRREDGEPIGIQITIPIDEERVLQKVKELMEKEDGNER